jgi:hypothetical protein
MTSCASWCSMREGALHKRLTMVDAGGPAISPRLCATAQDKIEPDPRGLTSFTETGIGYRLRARLEPPMKISDFHAFNDARAATRVVF